MDLGLRGKVAIVGGASQGIGFAIARLLAAEGADVAMVARKAGPLAQAVAKVSGQNGGRAFAVAADIRSAADCERIVASAGARLILTPKEIAQKQTQGDAFPVVRIKEGGKLTTPLIFFPPRSCTDSQGFPTRSGDFVDECASWGWKRRTCAMADG